MGEWSNTRILNHFAGCPAVTKDKRLLLGDKRSAALRAKGIKLPSSGSLAQVYQELSNGLHRTWILGPCK